MNFRGSREPLPRARIGTSMARSARVLPILYLIVQFCPFAAATSSPRRSRSIPDCTVSPRRGLWPRPPFPGAKRGPVVPGSRSLRERTAITVRTRFSRAVIECLAPAGLPFARGSRWGVMKLDPRTGCWIHGARQNI